MSAVLAPRVEMLPMNANDLDDVLAIESAVYPFPWTRGNFADSLAAGYSAWVCRIGGELVGYAVIMMVLDEAHLLNISVDQSRHGMGFGARLLRHAMSVARTLGARMLLLEVRPSNERALQLYKHFGFVRIGVRKAYYPAHDGREDALVLTHVLAEVKA
ncbi:MAG: ribosomal-protein-alanine N-acetyltransferase [Rhodocyclaceae bacterium]|nr:MAG: ribosomal-protein-alanine N-acetyltransferase [Rhodocyclaceae bacterium]